MPFHPTKPANNTDVSSQEMRDQLNSLIDGIPAGETGAPGEVTNATLATEIAGTARNPNTVAPLSLGTTDPQITAIVDKINELIAALAR